VYGHQISDVHAQYKEVEVSGGGSIKSLISVRSIYGFGSDFAGKTFDLGTDFELDGSSEPNVKELVFSLVRFCIVSGLSFSIMANESMNPLSSFMMSFSSLTG
jgi:hypothetical protein